MLRDQTTQQGTHTLMSTIKINLLWRFTCFSVNSLVVGREYGRRQVCAKGEEVGFCGVGVRQKVDKLDIGNEDRVGTEH